MHVHRGTCTVHRMATQKRRVVYLSDAEWAIVEAEARRHAMTISAYLRSLITKQPPGTLLTIERFSTRPFTPVPKPKK